MQVIEAQQEARTTFFGGAPGQVVSGVLWLASAAIATWVGRVPGMFALAVGGAFIFPITTLVLTLAGRRPVLSPANPFTALFMQVAFTIPLVIPVILGAAAHRPGWFYPGFLIVVGAHYLPFIFLYGMRIYAVLAGVLIGGGLVLGMTRSDSFTIAGWYGGLVLLGFGTALWAAQAGQQREVHAP
jgi:hypothetical protein